MTSPRSETCYGDEVEGRSTKYEVLLSCNKIKYGFWQVKNEESSRLFPIWPLLLLSTAVRDLVSS